VKSGVTAFLAVLLLALATVLPAHADERPVVLATFSILGDFVREVAGDQVDLKVLAPVGAEVHEYELRPRDFIALENADLVFYNGYNLEQWMGQVRATVGEGVPVIPLAERSDLETRPIVTGDFSGDPDPHMWMDPRAAKVYVEQIADALSKVAPAHESVYRENAERYQARLADLHEEIRETLAAIPEDRRTLISSEAAFLYFAHAYDFHHDGIWGTNTETEGSSRQIMRVIDIIQERQPKAVFWESTISSRYVEGVSEDAGVAVAGPLYVDSLGASGSGADSYLKMMRENARVLREALADD